jgi:hypothetical protein
LEVLFCWEPFEEPDCDCEEVPLGGCAGQGAEFELEPVDWPAVCGEPVCVEP